MSENDTTKLNGGEVPNAIEKLGLRYEWSTLLTLEEDHDIDFFNVLQNPIVAGLSGIITIIHEGLKTTDPTITREAVVDKLRGRKGPIDMELKAVFDEIGESMDSSDPDDKEETQQASNKQ